MSALSVLYLLCAVISTAATPDYSKESIVIQEFSTDVSFEATGTYRMEQTAIIRVQSEAAVRDFGVLAFNYDSDNSSINVAYVRVRKPDGAVVETPAENIQDVTSEIVRTAPTYSDLHQKQIPVKALSVGDTLEYKTISLLTKPLISGHFWHAQNFTTGVVVLNETLRISTPADKYVNVVSPTLKPEVHEEAGRKIYFWKTAQLNPTPQEADKKKPATPASSFPAVQVTTFHGWDELGRWYATLQADRVKVTPAIQAKADELTKGLTGDDAKARAIYNYVSTQFRYISISLGQGRYQPHFAADVLSNQYGDCKDKHTLFASLLNAAGIEAWPVLINSSAKVDPAVPSPAQFDHVITLLPKQRDPNQKASDQKTYVWLDTTPEVAPYGYLAPVLRDKQSLVVPTTGPATLMTTPAQLPFPDSEKLNVEGELFDDGTLVAHFDISLRDDAEIIYRAAFRSVSPPQWQELTQGLVNSMGFAGTVSSVEPGNPSNLDKPFQLAYVYKRETYSDWANRRILAPLFYLALPYDEKAPKPAEPVELGSPGEFHYHATIKLPKDYSADVPKNLDVQSAYAEYHATYSLSNGALSVTRRLIVKEPKAPLSAWDEFVDIAKKIQSDQSQFIQLTTSAPAPETPEVAALVRRAAESIRSNELVVARDQLIQAERLNPKQRDLWVTFANLDFVEHNKDKVIPDLEKELQNFPGDPVTYNTVVLCELQTGHIDKAIQTLRDLVKLRPDDPDPTTLLSSVLITQKRYQEALEAVRPALARNPDNRKLKAGLALALLHDGPKDEAVAAVKDALKDSADSISLNDIAYEMAVTNTDPSDAKEYAQKAVSLAENEMKNVTLTKLTQADLGRVVGVARMWDTLGWAQFVTGDLDRAKKYLEAAWKLSLDSAVADHLGQLYAREGNKDKAGHFYKLALTINSSLDATRQRLRQLELPPPAPVRLSENTVQVINSEAVPMDELNLLRTTLLPELPQDEGSAQFFILFSANKVEDVQFISGDDHLKSATVALMKAHYDTTFPDNGPERIARRGILSCSTYTKPSCQFTFLLPSTTRK